MSGDSNAELAKPEWSMRAEEIAVALATTKLEDTSAHFLPRHKFWSMDGRTCIIKIIDRVVSSQTE